MNPIKIEFKVENDQAVKGIKKISTALDEVNKAASSPSSAPNIEVKTNAPEVTQQTQTLATTLHDFTSTAKQAQEASVINFQMGSAESDLKALEQALKSTSEEAKQASSEASTALQATEELIKKQAEAEKQASLKTKIAADDFAHSQLIKKGSLEDLNKALAEYREALSRTSKNENAAGFLHLEKRIASTEQAITKQTKAIEQQQKRLATSSLAEQRRNAEIIRSGSIVERMFSEVAAATIEAGAAAQAAGVKMNFFSRSMVKASAAVRAFGVAIKSMLASVALVLVLLEGATWLLGKAWSWLTGWLTKGERAAKKASDTISKQADETSRLADEAERAANSALHDYNAREQEQSFLESVEKITKEYKEQTSEIERQLRLRKYGLDEEARAIEHAHDIKKAEIELAAIREGWTDRQLEVALRGNEASRNNALGVLSSKQEQAEVEAAEKKKQAAERTETRANDLILSQAFAYSDAQSLQDSLSRLPLLVKQADKAQKQQNEAITGEQQARALLALVKRGWIHDDYGSDLEGEDLEKVKKNLSILGLEEADIKGLSSKQLQQAFRDAEDAYRAAYKEVSEESIDDLRSLMSKSRLSVSTFTNADGTLDTELAERMVTTILNNAINARAEADKARSQREEADSNLSEAQTRKTTQSKARARSAEIATKRATVDDARYQAEIDAQALREKQELELERRDALYSTSNSDRLNRRVKKLRGREDTAFNQADEENARAALEEKVLAEADAILEDGRISKEEISRLPSILEKMETVGISKDVIAMLRQLEQMASQQADESSYLRSELRAIRGKMAITERAITQLSKGR